VTDRSFTPHELRQKAISVLDQLERLAADWRHGHVPAAAEIDIVTESVVVLRARIAQASGQLPAADREALEHLEGARARVLDAVELVHALAEEHPGRVPDLRSIRAIRGDAGPTAGS
jgi:hypothetical protein